MPGLTRPELERLDRAGLGRALRAGAPLRAEDLAGRVYRGTALALPRLVQAVSWRRFAKVFWRDEPGGPVRGWNVRVAQDPARPWEPLRRRDGHPRTFGHFLVLPADPRQPLAGCDRGLVLDYGWQGRRALAPLGRMRDPLVSVNGDPDLLLGVSVLELGFARLGTPTFFCLERAEEARQPEPAPA